MLNIQDKHHSRKNYSVTMLAYLHILQNNDNQSLDFLKFQISSVSPHLLVADVFKNLLSISVLLTRTKKK